MRYHILDTETAGLKSDDNASGVCEISVREVDPDNLATLDHYYSLIDPEMPISASASGVHGILDRHVIDAPTMEEFLTIVLDKDPWAPGQEPFWFIAYSAPFDYRFLQRYIGCEHQVADVLVLTRRYYPEADNHKLQTLRVWLDLPFDVKDAHSAGGDTQSLIYLIQRLMQDTGMTLEELCIDSLRKDPIVKMPFGKYKGQLIEDVVKSDKQYLRWMLKQDINEDLRAALESAI